MFVALSELEDSFFADKTSIFVALGPVTKIPNTRTPFVNVATTFYDVIADAADLFGIYNIAPANWLGTRAEQEFCETVP